jgi:hypothetical protein
MGPVMHIDRASFFLALGAFAAGGAGGYLAGERRMIGKSPSDASPAAVPEAPRAAPVMSVEKPAPSAIAAPRAPLCDDSVGSPGACPAIPHPSDEGGCPSIAAKRCVDFKESMKPRIAERAVACLNALTPAERCDPARVNLCGHVALMSSCDVVAPPTDAGTGDDVASRCQSIRERCGTSGVSPAPHDCRATLAGLTSTGRDRMVQCVTAHCSDKGLLGCEALASLK